MGRVYLSVGPDLVTHIVPIWRPIVLRNLLPRIADEVAADVLAFGCHVLPGLICRSNGRPSESRQHHSPGRPLLHSQGRLWLRVGFSGGREKSPGCGMARVYWLKLGVPPCQAWLTISSGQWHSEVRRAGKERTLESRSMTLPAGQGQVTDIFIQSGSSSSLGIGLPLRVSKACVLGIWRVLSARLLLGSLMPRCQQ